MRITAGLIVSKATKSSGLLRLLRTGLKKNSERLKSGGKSVVGLRKVRSLRRCSKLTTMG
jgi:hypothetical protein